MADAQVEAQAPVALFKKRKTNTNARKRPATPPPAGSDSDYSSEDESGVRVKRRKKQGVAVTATNARLDFDSLNASKHQADASSTIELSNDATKQSNWYDEADDTQLLGKSSLADKKEKSENGIYKGAANYSTHITKNPNAPAKLTGPVKAPTNVRTVTMMDYKPDICKDYSKTGFCGFGDSCIFLHDRVDWKQGWQLDRDWEIEHKDKKPKGKTVASVNRNATKEALETEEEAKLLESIPFACKICEKPYRKPTVQTRCGHYFCEKCALDRYRKNTTCAMCGADTNGVFNNAKQLNKLLDRKRAREEKRKEKEEAEKDDDE